MVVGISLVALGLAACGGAQTPPAPKSSSQSAPVTTTTAPTTTLPPTTTTAPPPGTTTTTAPAIGTPDEEAAIQVCSGISTLQVDIQAANDNGASITSVVQDNYVQGHIPGATAIGFVEAIPQDIDLSHSYDQVFAPLVSAAAVVTTQWQALQGQTNIQSETDDPSLASAVNAMAQDCATLGYSTSPATP